MSAFKPAFNGPAKHHALKRTNPKGPGIPFIGRCILCGATGLCAGAALEACKNPKQITQEQALLEVI